MSRFLGALAVLTLLLAACGSDEDDFREQLKELDPSITDETVDCIISELDDRGLSVTDISDNAIGDGEIPLDAQEALFECLSAGFLSSDSTDSTDSSGTSDSSGSSGAYGSDAGLDALWDGCLAGDGAACDDLYFQAPIGSEYEEYGDTCGGRYEVSPGLCETALG